MKKFLFFSLSLLIQLALLEGGAALYKNIWGDSLDRAKDLLVVDKKLGWRQKANLEQRFYQTQVVTDNLGLRNSHATNSTESFKVLVLGPSSTFGWGVEQDETYSAYLQQILEKKLQRQVDVLNAGQIGFSSEQGRLLIQEDWVKQFKPDWVVLAYGVNDIDRHRFYFQSEREDKDQLANIERKEFLFSYLKNEVLFLRIGMRYLKKIASNFTCPSTISVPKLRVEHQDFINNIKEMAKMLPSNLILLDTAHAYKSPGRDNKKTYEMAQVAFENNECDKGRELLKKALESETNRITNDVYLLNQNLEKQAKDMGAKFLSAYSLIGGERNMSSFFVDPVHPNVAGHKKIAEHLSEVILSEK